MNILLDRPIYNKKNLYTTYLNEEQYIEFFLERAAKVYKKESTEECARKMWRRAHKETVDGILYYPAVNHRDWMRPEEYKIAQKYGFEVIKEYEWMNI